MTVDVALRLGIQGSQEVGKAFDDTGRKGEKALKDIRQEASKLPPHLVAVSRSVGVVRDQVDDLHQRSGALGQISSSFGAWGTAVAVGVTAIAAGAATLINQAEAAIAVGDALGDAAGKIGISTDALQEWRFIAVKAGGEIGDADTALAGFTKTLGAAEAGNQKALKTFKMLGFTQADIKSFKDVDTAILEVSKKIAGLGKESQRQFISEKLGLGPLIPALREGSDWIEQMQKRAHDLGYVLDKDLIVKAGDAADKLEDLREVTKVQLNAALIEAAPLVLAVAGAMAEGSKQARGFFDEIRDGLPILQEWIDKIPGAASANKAVDWLAKNTGPVGLANWAVGKAGAAGRQREMQDMLAEVPNGVRDLMAGKPVDLTGTEWAGAGKPKAPPTGQLGDLGADAAASSASRDAERAADKAKQASERTDAMILAAQQRKLRALQGIANTVEAQAALELGALDAAHEDRLATIRRDAADGRLDAAKAKLLIAEEQRAHDAEAKAISDRERREIEARQFADLEQAAQLSADLLSLQSSEAKTAEERRAIELQLLEISQRRARAALERELADRGDLSEEDKQSRRADLAKYQGAERGSVERQNAGPLATYARTLMQTNADVRESLENLAVEGFGTLNEGIVSAIMKTGDLGDTFKQIGDQIVAALLNVIVQVAILGPMLDALGQSMGGGGGGGSWIDKLVSVGVSALVGGAAGGGAHTGGNKAAGINNVQAGRATGGPIYRGDTRPVFEEGVERFAQSSADAYVFDAARTARDFADARSAAASTYGSGGGAGPITVNAINATGERLEINARQSFDDAGGPVVDLDINKSLDRKIERGNRDLFGGGYDRQFQETYGVRRRLTGG